MKKKNKTRVYYNIYKNVFLFVFFFLTPFLFTEKVSADVFGQYRVLSSSTIEFRGLRNLDETSGTGYFLFWSGTWNATTSPSVGISNWANINGSTYFANPAVNCYTNQAQDTLTCNVVDTGIIQLDSNNFPEGPLTVEFYDSVFTGGVRIFYTGITFSSTTNRVIGGGVNGFIASTTIEDIPSEGFISFLNVMDLLKTKEPFAYLPTLWDILQHPENYSTSTIPYGYLTWTFASGTPAERTFVVDLFSTSTIAYYINPTILNILRTLMVVITYISTIWFIYHDLKNRKII